MAVSACSSDDPILITFTSGNVHAVGATVFLSTDTDWPLTGTFVVEFSDGTTNSVEVSLDETEPYGFVGFSSSYTITQVRIPPISGLFVNLDDLYVSPYEISTSGADTTPPPAPTNLRTASSVGARRVVLAWNASVDAPDPTKPVSYKIYRDGLLLRSGWAGTQYTDAPGPEYDPSAQLLPSSVHSYRVNAVDAYANESAPATTVVTTAPEVAVPGYFTGQGYSPIPGLEVSDLTLNDAFPSKPYFTAWWLSGLSYGDQTAFGDTFGDDYGLRFAGTLTAPKTAQYRFFLRSDNASAFWLDSAGPALPDPLFDTPIAEETDCCQPFPRARHCE